MKCKATGRTEPSANISAPKPQAPPILKAVMPPSSPAIAAPPKLVAPAMQQLLDRGIAKQPDKIPTAPVAQPTDLPSMKDALTIMSVLHEHYISRDKGYDSGWSDKKIAADINVPAAWVKAVRVEYYGDGATAGNEDVEKIAAETAKLIAECKAMLAAADTLKKKTETDLATIDAIRKKTEADLKTLTTMADGLRKKTETDLKSLADGTIVLLEQIGKNEIALRAIQQEL